MVRLGRKKASGLVTAVLLLGGCAGPSASPWRTAAPAPPIEGPQQAVFCYKTLADVVDAHQFQGQNGHGYNARRPQFHKRLPCLPCRSS